MLRNEIQKIIENHDPEKAAFEIIKFLVIDFDTNHSLMIVMACFTISKAEYQLNVRNCTAAIGRPI